LRKRREGSATTCHVDVVDRLGQQLVSGDAERRLAAETRRSFLKLGV